MWTTVVFYLLVRSPVCWMLFYPLSSTSYQRNRHFFNFFSCSHAFIILFHMQLAVIRFVTGAAAVIMFSFAAFKTQFAVERYIYLFSFNCWNDSAGVRHQANKQTRQNCWKLLNVCVNIFPSRTTTKYTQISNYYRVCVCFYWFWIITVKYDCWRTK